MKIILKYLAVILVLALLANCNARKKYTNKKAKNLVYTENDLLEINIAPFQANENLTEIFVEIKNDNLLYKRTDTSRKFFAEVKITYSLYADQNLKKLIDSSSFSMIDEEEAEIVSQKLLSNQFYLQCMYGANYYLSVEVIDINRKSRNIKTLSINKSNNWNNQNFKIFHANKLAYTNKFMNHQALKIIPADKLIDRVFVDYYKTEIPQAPPPYSSKQNFNYEMKPDSNFAIYKEQGCFEFNTPPQGFYFLKLVNEVNQGFAIYSFNSSFPGVNNEIEMIKCCRYIMTKEEFETMLNAPEKKTAIDKFWLEIGGSKERAKEILKKYYLRVKYANENFTSYKEGWKTDRGMIAIIFGEPTNIYKSAKDEIWVYGIETNPSSLRFVFNKNSNVFSDNDFVLERSDFYKDVYFQAVDFWRQGIVYTDRGVER